MATYRQIEAYVKEKYGYKPKGCWIAHVKEICGLNPKKSPNRYSPDKREVPCPPHKQNDIKEAFLFFKMI